MRGEDASTAALFGYVSCEARVPAEHPLKRPAFFAYADNYLIDMQFGIIVDVEVSRGVRQAEVGAARISTPLYKSSKCFLAWCKMAADNSGSVTIRDIMTAPIIAVTATKARAFAASGFVRRYCLATIPTSLRNPAVATVRVHVATSCQLASQPGEQTALRSIVPAVRAEILRNDRLKRIIANAIAS